MLGDGAQLMGCNSGDNVVTIGTPVIVGTRYTGVGTMATTFHYLNGAITANGAGTDTLTSETTVSTGDVVVLAIPGSSHWSDHRLAQLQVFSPMLTPGEMVQSHIEWNRLYAVY